MAIIGEAQKEMCVSLSGTGLPPSPKSFWKFSSSLFYCINVAFESKASPCLKDFQLSDVILGCVYPNLYLHMNKVVLSFLPQYVYYNLFMTVEAYLLDVSFMK